MNVQTSDFCISWILGQYVLYERASSRGAPTLDLPRNHYIRFYIQMLESLRNLVSFLIVIRVKNVSDLEPFTTFY